MKAKKLLTRLICALTVLWSPYLRAQTEDIVGADNPIVQKLRHDMVRVAGGTFMMGATEEQVDEAQVCEKPVHAVTLSTFLIGKYEVTQQQWQTIMGYNPSDNQGETLPVENVTWNECHEFIKRLNNLTGCHFRLPSEAEWEYAARGGVRSQRYKYSGSNNIDNVAWYDYAHFDWEQEGEDGQSSVLPSAEIYHTHSVGEKTSNELGLFDMSGNVGEWCNDWADWDNGKNVYTEDSVTDPKGLSNGTVCVVRGGSFLDQEQSCRVSSRSGMSPDSASKTIGFRLALDVSATAPSLQLVVVKKDGTESRFPLNRYPKVCVMDKNILIESEGQILTFETENTERIYYEPYIVTNIKNNETDEPFITINGKDVVLNNLTANATVEIYDINGQLLRSVKASQIVQMSLAKYPVGVYVVKANEKTFKILNR